MSRDVESVVSVGPVKKLEGSRTAGRATASHDRCILRVEGSLRAPLDGALRHKVRELLRRGEPTIVLDLTRVSKIDATGVGELVRAYNMTIAANGVLQIVHATARVRELLQRVGLFGLLSGDSELDLRAAATPRVELR